jgi:hypothetical protein
MPTLTIQIPADLKLEVRIRCRLDRMTLSAYLCDLIARDLTARGQLEPEPPTSLRENRMNGYKVLGDPADPETG